MEPAITDTETLVEDCRGRPSGGNVDSTSAVSINDNNKVSIN